VATQTAAIVGRDDQLAVIEEFLGEGDRRPRALVLAGEAGIGKTTLWRYAVDRARAAPWYVLTCSPAESEVQLAFASLRDLCDKLGEDVMSTLPPPQRRALEIALLRADPGLAPHERGAISAAFLSVVRRLAETSPLLIAIDDAQWLDTASAAVLEFAARRTDSAPVAFLVAMRRDMDSRVPLSLDRALPDDCLLRVEIGPLSLGAMHRLLSVRLDRVVPRPILRRLHEVSGGNPFFALELARALERRGGRAEPGEALPERLHELVAERLAALPDDALAVVQVAAALSNPTVGLVVAVAERGASSIDAAVEAQVIESEADRIRFTHPLLASGAYSALGPVARRALHARLAEAVDEPEERARHLALAAEGVDAAVAAELEEAAHLARARGAPAVAAELGEQARRLTPPEEVADALRRTMETAGFHFEAGDAARSRALLEEAVGSSAHGPHRAEALKRLARALAFEADLPSAADLYRRAIAEAADESSTRAEAEQGLAVALMRMLSNLPEAADHARTAAQLAERRGDDRALAEFLSTQALIEGLTGDPGAGRVMSRAVGVGKRIGDVRGLHRADFLVGLRGPFIAAVLRAFTGDIERARTVVERARAEAVEMGDEASLPLILRYLSYVELLAGNWRRSRGLASEGYEVAVQTGQASQQAVLVGTSALVDAHLGRVEESRREAAEALALAAETGAMFARLLADSALGLLELSLGDPAAALERLEPLVQDLEEAGLREPAAARFVPDAIEAMLAVGRLGDAESLLRRFESRSARLDRTSARAVAARCRALLLAAGTDFEGALAHLEGALKQHQRAPIPFDSARTLVVLGATRRRARQKASARAALGAAAEEFDRLGAELWAREARAELARIGGRPPSGGRLTPTQRRLAELVSEGLSNKEVAAALFVTPKTVETQLSRIYTKLGIHSRTELARSLAKRPDSVEL
jgi:DNA-binding CsgD family transcriptional regulator